MIQLIGIRHDVEIDIRQKLSIIPKRLEDALIKVASFCGESVIISTCNRTEVYFNSEITDSNIVNSIFDCLRWGRELVKYTFHLKGQDAVRHLIEVVCGFDSIVLGEDQILGQVKEAYEKSLEANTVRNDLLRLFQTAVTCGKEFRAVSRLSNIPVSTASMVVREAKNRGIKKFMILGFGEIGNLASKHIMENGFEALYIAVRNADSVDISHPDVHIIPFAERDSYYSCVDCIISCTSAPHTVIKKSDLPQKNFLIFDMAVPRDVDAEVNSISGVEVYDIDMIGSIKDDNYNRRKELMEQYKFIIDKYMTEFEEWHKLKPLSPHIQKIRQNGELICRKRSITYRNKKDTRDNEELVEMLLKSTSNAYVNRAIEVLKEEYLKGRGDECLKIIEKIFAIQDEAI